MFNQPLAATLRLLYGDDRMIRSRSTITVISLLWIIKSKHGILYLNTKNVPYMRTYIIWRYSKA